MKNIKKIFSLTLAIALALSIFNLNTTKAQTEIPEGSELMEMIQIATVNIYDAASTKINNKTYKISFLLTNREGIQPNVRYGIKLVRRYSSDPVDLHLVNQEITLGENDQKEITLEYSIPDYISDGVYRMLIVAQNQNGLLLASSPTSFPEKFIVIENSAGLDLENCYLQVEGEGSDITYTIRQGVTINAGEETLIANCDIVNSSSKSGDVRLQLITHKRDQLGDILSNEILEETISLKGKSTQSVSFTLPVITTPQAYDVDAFLINEKGEKVSYSKYLHYVVAGDSATIQNVLLDKTDYLNNDKALLQLLWTGPADTFTYSRIPGEMRTYIADAEIKNQEGEHCGHISKTLTNPEVLGDEILTIDIIRDCPAAVAEVSISDGSGNVLDSTKIDLNAPAKNIKINALVTNSSFSSLSSLAIYTVLVVLALIVIAYGILILKKNKKVGKNN